MSENKEVKELLEEIQWSNHGSCPICNAFTTDGHYKNCELSQALTLLEKQPDCKTCMCMDCGKVIKTTEQSKHLKECPKCAERRSCGVGELCPDCKPEAEFAKEWIRFLDNYYDCLGEERAFREIERGLRAACNIIKYLKPFEIAVKKRHNGYDTEAAKALGIEPPESPEQALQDLQDGWNRLEDDWAKTQVELQAKIDRLEEQVDYWQQLLREKGVEIIDKSSDEAQESEDKDG